MRIAVILLAAGSGKRFSENSELPKQFINLLGHPVIYHAAQAFLPHVDCIQPVGDTTILNKLMSKLSSSKILPTVCGGIERQHSVYAGVEALSKLPRLQQPDIVLIHDGARPNVPPYLIQNIIKTLQNVSAVIPAVPVAETLKRNRDGFIDCTIIRENLFRAQTPQGFHFKPLLHIHRQVTGLNATDDASLFEQAGLPVKIIEGDESNIKLTYPNDLKRLECFMKKSLYPRMGSGFDVHAFVDNRPLYLCGIKIPYERGLMGHSDADVGLHALCDAIYGALAEGDIGTHFPPADAQWKNADSKQFLIHARERLKLREGNIINLDITLICERPKLRPYVDEMRTKIADLLKINIGRVSIKATTTEKLGFSGREEGIACHAIASILIPDNTN